MSVKTIQAKDLVSHQDLESLCLVDVRTPAEVRSDSLKTILAVPLDQLKPELLAKQIEQDYSNAEQVYLICQSGKRAQLAADKLAGKLSQELVVVEGGMNAIRQAQGLKQATSTVMSIERQVRLIAGGLVVLGVTGGYLLHPGWFILSGLVGAGLMYAAITDSCGMGLLIAKAPWNK